MTRSEAARKAGKAARKKRRAKTVDRSLLPFSQWTEAELRELDEREDDSLIFEPPPGDGWGEWSRE